MANIKSAAKRARQTVTRTAQNRSALRAIKTNTKAFEAAKTPAALKTVSSALDKAVKSGRVHKNLANRRKSRMAKKLTAA